VKLLADRMCSNFHRFKIRSQFQLIDVYTQEVIHTLQIKNLAKETGRSLNPSVTEKRRSKENG